MLGAIADDYTGGTDVAVAFRRAGLRTVVLFGGPGAMDLPEHDAIVVALKSRTIDAEDAVRVSLDAARWLQARGADQVFFKYCSTFDSGPKGNIGPVADALADFLGATQVAAVPASPEHLRTQYLGHLFVDRVLLSESPMRHHPLTPMTDSFIPRVLARQTSRPVELVELSDVQRGWERVRACFDRAAAGGARYVVVDAISGADLIQIGQACLPDRLVTGAAGLAEGLGIARYESLRDRGSVPVGPLEHDLIGDAPAAVLAGSCSARTLEQVAFMQASHDSYRLDPIETPNARALAERALSWVDGRTSPEAPLIYSSMPTADLQRVQHVLGAAGASVVLEAAMGLIATGLVERGVRRLVVAGGETSGAVVTALGVAGGVIGKEAAPGVPWIYTTGERPLALLLKSGNFGAPPLLARSVEKLVFAGVPS